MRYVILVLIICSLACPGFAQDPGWPREKSNAGGSVTYYQPQLDAWKDFKQLEARMAVSIRPKGGQPTVGVVYIQASTDANTETRNVLLSNVQITSTKFPSLDAAGSAAMDQLVRSFLMPGASINISLDRLLADMEVIKNPPPSVAVLKNDPPKIFVSYRNAILLLVEGEPVRVPIEKTNLEFVVNTNWGLFFDKSASQYYLLNEKQWLTSSALQGPWTVTAKLPAEMSKLPDQPNWIDVKKAIPPAAPTSYAPKVFYSTAPAEIISFKGQPKYAKIPDTNLSYATNTESTLFLQGGENQYYFLVSGRWFRSKSLDGPWTFASTDLPADFAKIPASSPVARVLVSVPGTNEAEDAVLLAQVPTTVIVDRAKAEAEVKVAYDGPPQFKPIESTSMSYATNTADKIVKVGDLYYLCFQGVWFMSTSAEGPWKTADSVPKEIYTIPASSPVYNITYVTQTTTSSGATEASSTAGYLGVFIIGATVGATIAYGSGYYYPPYYYYGPYPYPIYRPYPVTYGVGAYYNPHNGTYGYARGAYGPYGGVAGGAWYNPSTGTYGRAAGGCNVYGCAGGAAAYNPYTGAYGATRQGSNAYSQWGSSVVTKGDKWAQSAHYSDSRGTVAGARTSEGGRVVGGSGQNGSGFVGQSGSGDVYAGKDGNVYKKTNNGWQKYENGGWNSVNSSGTKSTSQAQTNSAQNQRSQNAQSASTVRQPSTQPATAPTNSGEKRSIPNSSSQASSQRGQSGQASPGTTNPAQRSTQPSASQRPASVGQYGAQSSQVQDLNREAQARQTGSQRTQSFERENRSGGAGRTGGSGQRSSRR